MNNETLADIIDEMRTRASRREISPEVYGLADRIEAAAARERIQREKVSFRCGDCARFGGDCDAGDSDGNEDRVACEKFVRRALVPGNAASMRAALEAMLEECCNLCDVPNQMSESGHTCSWRNRWSGCQSKAIDKARAALSAPPRNCDRFKAADEARMAFWDTHETIWDAFKNRGGTELFYEVLDWLFAPAEGKEASNG